MAIRNALLVAVAAALPVVALVDSVNVYFGQHGVANISDVCADPSFEYITLGFITTSPENAGLSGYPGDNFAGHCWVGYYDNDGIPSELLSECPYLVPGIEVCQKQYNKKVLLSIGGETLTGSYSVSSYENGVDFGNFLWNSFGPYNPDLPNQPRPFDSSADTHIAVDGYDFDIEWMDAGDEGYQGVIETLRSNIEASGRSDIITAAPQCVLDATNQMWNLLHLVRFDRLFVQFYNNPSCNILNVDGSLNQEWNYPAWETFLAGTPSANATIHVGLPGSDLAASNGYVDADIASTLMCILQASDYPMFGGVSIWDQTFAAANTDANGTSYNEILYNAMRCGCDVCPEVISSSSTLSSFSTVFSSSTQSSSVQLTGRPSSVSTQATGIPSSVPTQITGRPSSVSTQVTGRPSVSSQVTGRPSSVSTQATGSPSSVPTQITGRPSSVSSQVTGRPSSVSTQETGRPSSVSTQVTGRPSSVSTQETGRPSSVSTQVTGRPSSSLLAYNSTGGFPTVSIPSSSAVSSGSQSSPIASVTGHTRVQTHTGLPSHANSTVPVGPGGHVTSTAASSHVTSSVQSSSVQISIRPSHFSNGTGTAHQTTSSSISVATPTSSQQFTTSTVYSTTIYTVTSCAATVTDCPARVGSVTTEIIAVSTTLCAVSGTESTSTQTAPSTGSSSAAQQTGSTSTGSSSPAQQTSLSSSSVQQYTTSTVYSTSVYTVTSCAATVTDCPARVGSVTTEIIAVSTTICPVTATEGTSTKTVSTDSSPAAQQTGTIGTTSTGSSSPAQETGATGTQSRTVVATTSQSVQQLTTSTVYSTSIYTVTSCAPTVTDCPARVGSITTEIIAISTTICPVTAEQATATHTSSSSSSPAETGVTGGNSGSNSGSNVGSAPVNDKAASSPSTQTATVQALSTITVVSPPATSTVSANKGSSPVGSSGSHPAGSLNGTSLVYNNGTATATSTQGVTKIVAPTKAATTTAVAPIVTAGAASFGVGTSAILAAIVAFLL